MNGAVPAGVRPDLRDRSVLLLDLSRSMLAPLPEPDSSSRERQKIEVARTAVYRILQEAARTGAPFGLVTFTETVRVPVPLRPVQADHLPFIENLISLLLPSGRSAVWDAIAVGADLLRVGPQGVRGNLVLVTDGWDNASVRYTVRNPANLRPQHRLADLVPYILPSGSQLNFRILGIGSGSERDKGVDAAQMNLLLNGLRRRADEIGASGSFSFQEVTTGSQLFAQMVQAFLDVGYGDDAPLEQLHPEELARTAATAAKALKTGKGHEMVGRLHFGPAAATASSHRLSGPRVEVGVLSPADGTPAFLKDRYGPLGEVVEAYLGGEFDQALALLARSAAMLPAVTRWYWEARILFAQGRPTEAARALFQGWAETEQLPEESRAPIVRRLALLQSKLQHDPETEALVHFLDDAEHRLEDAKPSVRERLDALFASLLELRGTYELTRLAGEDAQQDAALRHEAAVELVFGRLQDARLELAGTGPVVDGALDFVEVCLAEMR